MIYIQDLKEDILNELRKNPISKERDAVLLPLVLYISKKIKASGHCSLNFICTHNSRRSQFAQVWAQVAASHFNIPVNSHSGGVEITACNERTIASLKRLGFIIHCNNEETNPKYKIYFSDHHPSIVCFSKLFSDNSSPKNNFGAVMTCSHADENCPIVDGMEKRLAVRYEDPKKYDDTRLEEIMYDKRSMQIAMEMFHTFQQVGNHLKTKMKQR